MIRLSLRSDFFPSLRAARGSASTAKAARRSLPEVPPACRLTTHGRFEYSGIEDEARPRYKFPGGAQLAVYVGLNLEHFAFGEGLGGQLVPHSGAGPDVLNYSWRDYGNRVGAWRMARLFDEFSIPVSVLANAAMVSHCPQLLARYLERGDELVAHGRTNAERQGDLDAVAEAALIAETTEVLAGFAGEAPAGWLGPWISQSRATLDLLKEAGYQYCLDWCMDDQPVAMTTCGRGAPLLAVPYPQELNDIPAIMVRRESASSFADMIIDNFEEMRRQAQESGTPLVMGIALHPYILGQPFRLMHLRRALQHIANCRADSGVWFTTAGDIARWHHEHAHEHSWSARGPALEGDDLRARGRGYGVGSLPSNGAHPIGSQGTAGLPQAAA